MSSAVLPFDPRALTASELSNEDVYITYSPKAARAVSLVGITRLAFFLKNEFDPAAEAVVERPRSLELYSGRTVELDFWTLGTDGRETFWAVQGIEECERVQDGLQPKDATVWDQAAHRAGLSLRFVFEHDLQHRAQSIANYLRLLPHIQAARRRAEVPSIAGRVKELFSPVVTSLSFQQIEGSLSQIPADVVRMATCTLLHEGWLGFQKELPLSSHSRLTRGANDGY
ncbi:hypothetical protein [Rhodanobacter lindaniclasticus]|uniref:TnsA endonuclease N-terminal domain-containing protein n=1 Tax=Rhodanobacter lindaniclasticus TaxID=75310 RepID=A0A4S3KKS1_9GAMM|nr:hypothetical protein [Rhodanobacter lindaniclasticus]THD09442.1 hypothetical protein B1991_02255 [Rhodanobacter lindaniclasticus]